MPPKISQKERRTDTQIDRQLERERERERETALGRGVNYVDNRCDATRIDNERNGSSISDGLVFAMFEFQLYTGMSERLKYIHFNPC